MKKMRFLMPIGIIGLVAGVSAIVMLLWNWLMPAIFGLVTINFWQAAGIFILARILFGKFGGRRNMMRGRCFARNTEGENPIREKWEQMTPEQRDEFVRKRREGGGFGNRERFFGGRGSRRTNDEPQQGDE